MMGIVHEDNFLVFLIDFVHKDKMPDMQPPESFKWFF
jgi:hypothetical protein